MDEKNTQTLTLESRERLMLTGVEKVDSFNDEIVILSTIKGKLTVKGNKLSISKLNVEEGKLTVNGFINSLIYSEKNDDREKVSLVKKLFR